VRIKALDIPPSPEEAYRAAESLMRGRNAAAAISVCAGAVNEALASAADEWEMPLILAESGERSVTMTGDDRPKLYSLRLNYDDRYAGSLAAYFLSLALKRARPAVVCEAYDTASYEMRAGFVSELEARGGTVACDEVWTRRGGLDRASVEEIVTASADAVVILNGTADISAVTGALRQYGYSGVILGLAFDDALDAAGGSFLDDSWWIVPAHGDDPQLQSFQAAYRDRYNENVSGGDFPGALLSYDAVLWVADALFTAPGFQGEALRHAFMSTRNLALTHATLTMDPSTHGPWKKAAAALYRSAGSVRFQRRFRPK
jgi:branched-chain amino acid transport system substrate-binding protein